MTRLSNGTWVLVADGEKALFLENQTDAEDPHLEVIRQEEQENAPNREQAANRRGRFNDVPSDTAPLSMTRIGISWPKTVLPRRWRRFYTVKRTRVRLNNW